MPSFAAQQSLFRAYDIRGTNRYFTDAFVQALAHSFAQLYSAESHHLTQALTQDIDANTADVTYTPDSTINVQEDTVAETIVVIGYDMRHGSERIARILSSILTQQGLRVIQLGLITTPMMAFWAEQHQGHGIIATASHSAKDILGIKWLVAHKSPSSTEIQTLYQQLIHNDDPSTKPVTSPSLDSVHTRIHTHVNTGISAEPSSELLQELPAKQVADTYIDAIENVFHQLPCENQTASAKDKTPLPKLDLTVVIDCMHGATGSITQRLFDRFCQHVIVLNDTPDGSFPLGNPDPAEPNRLTALQQAVASHCADIGLAFDGDGDRLMIVDNNGKVVMPDHLLYLLARIAITERPDSLTSSLASEVLFDIKCAHHLPKLLADLGAMPVISKTGSSFMRQQVQHPDSQIVFAGELSGHFIFNDGRFIPYDDAIYAALRLLHWFVKSRNILDDKNALSDILQRLPAMVSTADHYLPMPQTARTDCSIMEQLTRVCTYLQQLASVTTHADSFDISDYRLDAANLPTALCASPVCTCSTIRSHIAVEQAKSLLPAGTRLSCIDGVRLDFAHGFGVLRQSNTSNSLTARFAGDSMDDLKDIQATFAALCRPFDAELATQIIAMPAE
ncbi:phosphomannomutase [Psychrobacter pacificensis]|uniref:phosphomannomutase n=1 Tax=Psychrobacter pacificensis TaxID=112002 RepID=UPI003CFBCCA7